MCGTRPRYYTQIGVIRPGENWIKYTAAGRHYAWAACKGNHGWGHEDFYADSDGNYRCPNN